MLPFLKEPYDTILVVGDGWEDAGTYASTLADSIAVGRLNGQRHNAGALFYGIDASTLRNMLCDPNADPLPEDVKRGRRKLITAFDTVSNDLITSIARTIEESPAAAAWAASNGVKVLSMSSVIINHCWQHNITRVWYQEPLNGSFDTRLHERLASAGLVICKIDSELEKASVTRALFANDLYGRNYEREGEREAMHFWSLLDPEFKRASVQLVIASSGIPVLLRQREKSHQFPPAIAPDFIYMSAIASWSAGV